MVESLGKLPHPPAVFICASGINYYGHRLSSAADESAPSGDGFLSEVCREWETAATMAGDFGARVCLVRTGIVLSPAGGALGLMVKPFRAGLGGPVGSGTQVMSWIGLEDLLDIYLLALEDDSMEGPVNAVAPGAVSNREFGKTLGRVLHRPAVLPLPESAVHLAMGDMGREMLLADLPVRPRLLEKRGFPFRHSGLEECLRFTLGRTVASPAKTA